MKIEKKVNSKEDIFSLREGDIVNLRKIRYWGVEIGCESPVSVKSEKVLVIETDMEGIKLARFHNQGGTLASNAKMKKDWLMIYHVSRNILEPYEGNIVLRIASGVSWDRILQKEDEGYNYFKDKLLEAGLVK